jgi:GMP synthase-like glutamine amidotransferase
VAQAHAAGVPFLGVCFGAQVLCTALGGVVEASPTYELGWVEVQTDDPARVPAGPWFTWHGDRCLVPDDVSVLARNDVCVQAFASGRSLGVQFHPEVTADVVRTWVDGCPPWLLEREHVDPDALVASFERHGATAASSVVTMLDAFLDEHVR